uniref:Uncharacterized protein n=1 Tax=Anopheles darlingi TaxID=43151 RepID=A0A2M4DNG9_ANODA
MHLTYSLCVCECVCLCAILVPFVRASWKKTLLSQFPLSRPFLFPVLTAIAAMDLQLMMIYLCSTPPRAPATIISHDNIDIRATSPVHQPTSNDFYSSITTTTTTTTTSSIIRYATHPLSSQL